MLQVASQNEAGRGWGGIITGIRSLSVALALAFGGGDRGDPGVPAKLSISKPNPSIRSAWLSTWQCSLPAADLDGDGVSNPVPPNRSDIGLLPLSSVCGDVPGKTWQPADRGC